MNESNSEHDEEEQAECNEALGDIDKENQPKYSRKLDGKTIDNNVIYAMLGCIIAESNIEKTEKTAGNVEEEETPANVEEEETPDANVDPSKFSCTISCIDC